MKKLGQDPAFPVDSQAFKTILSRDQEPIGMSKRFYAACAAMQGLLSDFKTLETYYKKDPDKYLERIISDSYKSADELLEQENK